jgi:Tol biopolymer transport system component
MRIANYGITAFSLLATLILVFGILATPVQAQVNCLFTQITETSEGENIKPGISEDGTRIAFSSSSDLTGENPDGNDEIFLFDTGSSSFTQITDSTGGVLNGQFRVSLNSDGTRVAFSSNRDLTGDNADENDEIFLFDTNLMNLTPITDSTGDFTLSPDINSDGTILVFLSEDDLTGSGLEPGRQVFLFDSNGVMITPITNASSLIFFTPTINSDGTKIAFASQFDFTGDNADNNNEIFLFDTNTIMFTQITDTTAGNTRTPSINSDGTRIALRSGADLTGGNADGNDEIFLFDTNSMTFTQITDSTGNLSFGGQTPDNGNPSINSDGTRIAFQSNRDLTVEDDFGTDIYLFDTDSMMLTQITENDDFGDRPSVNPSISSDGTRIAFESRGDPLGENADHNREIFLAQCFEGGIPGDANGDGLINILDVTAILNNILGVSPAPGNGDCNEDGDVNILDVTCVLNIILGA